MKHAFSQTNLIIQAIDENNIKQTPSRVYLCFKFGIIGAWERRVEREAHETKAKLESRQELREMGTGDTCGTKGLKARELR